ncbi:MAG: T9SS type A sorting domain-containing protein [Chitinophagaceae bacterium]
MKKPLLKSLLLLLPFFSLAQVNVQNTGILYSTGSSDIVYIGGSFTNSSAASLTNNGNLYVIQDLINDQSFSSIGTGTLYLSGSATQTVSGSQTFKTYNLTTNNAAGITLNNNLSVANSHVYTSGLITTSATPNYMIYEAGSSYSGDNDSRHVNGWVKKFGNTAFIFPVGDATYERTIRLSSLSATSEFNVSYARPTPGTSSVQSPLVNIDPNEYWPTSKVSGGTAIATLNWDNSKRAFPNWVVANISVAGYNGSYWTDQGGSGTASGTVTTTGTVSSSAITSFNYLTFGSKTFPIPLRLISFNAIKEPGDIKLEWTTENEASVSNFEVEKSTDGKNFVSVKSIQALNTGNRTNYIAYDSTALPAIVYYRLKSIDIDGRISYSNVVSIRSTDDQSQVTLVANPVHDQATLQFVQPKNNSWTVLISSATGQLLSRQTISTNGNGYYRIPINTEWTPGIYVLAVSDGQQHYTFRLVKN